jgi:hypothetical protein
MLSDVAIMAIERRFLGKREISIILSRFVIYLAVGICFAFVALILQANIGNVPLFSFLRMVAFWYVIWGYFYLRDFCNCDV